MQIPFPLRQALQDGTCVLFIGAGLGHYMKDEGGGPIPDASQLARILADKFRVPVEDTNVNLAKVSQYIEVKHGGRRELTAYISQVLAQAEPDESIMWIPSIKWKAIFTTNYDNVIQKAYDRFSHPKLNYVTITRSTGIRDFDPHLEVPIFHVHGSLFASESPDIIITERDFVKYREQRKMMFEQLKHYMASSCVLYVGYSHNDPNWNQLLLEVEEEFLPEQVPTAYRVDPYTSALEIELLKARNIITLSQRFDEFVDDASIQVEKVDVTALDIQNLKSRIPSGFVEDYDSNPVAVLRLLNAWTFVNEIPATELKSDVFNYVRGDRPSWGTVFDEGYFTRDIESEVYEAILDYITEPRQRVQVCLISAPAGYGTTSLLMILAAKLVKERAGVVFFHQESQELREGDIEYALSRNTRQRCVFFIDNAADHTRVLRAVLRRARETRMPAVFVLGDRTNEWAQSRPTIAGNTFEIQPLSDTEIERLIDFLAQHGELNKLEELSREHQIAAIRKNYERELLVAIREATEGLNLGAILENEYWGIRDDFSIRAYSIICCFNQHGALLRVDLLADLLGVTLPEYYDRTRGFLDGVVKFSEINQIDGQVAVRARHRLIARIVWDRCVSSADKQMILHESLAKMNIMHSIDKSAFESFIRSDRIVDELRTLDSKIRFFETAINKDPDNPYVRQHYSRMFMRADEPAMALRIIDEAIEMNGKIASLYHTKGTILSQMAISASSDEVGRRTLLHSENAFYTGLRMDEKDDYFYQGLSRLYLGWAERQDRDENQRTLYLEKAEEIINEGLKLARDKESLWIESARIDEFLDDQPGRIRALEHAVKNAPKSIIARYLLAKAYNMNGRRQEGLQLLAELSRDYPDEYRPTTEYALASLRFGGSLGSAIAIMNQSTLYGYSDPTFVATYGGLLYLNKEFDRADEVFNQATTREFRNARRVLFDPVTRLGWQQEYEASVKYVGDNYSYLLIPGFPDVTCRASKYHGIVLRVRMKLCATLAFTPRGPVVNNIRLLSEETDKSDLSGVHATT